MLEAAVDFKSASIIERLPRTADGVPFFIGDELYIPNPDRGYFGSEDVLKVKIEAISKGASFVEYRGDFTISGSGSDIEGGNLDFYSTREAASRMLEMTPEEADAAYDDSPAIPMSEEEIDEIVTKVTGDLIGRNAELHNENE